MRLRSLLPLLLLSCLLPASLHGQTAPAADSLIQRYVEAIGGRDAHTAVQSLRTAGTIQIAAMGLSGDFELLQLAPDRMLLRVSLPGVGELLNGYDGEVGWNVDPLSGPRLLSGDELEARRERSNMLAAIRDDSLVPGRETVEHTEVEGRECWRVRLTWASGRETYDCYSTESGLLIAAEETQISQMGEIPVTIHYHDYESFEGGLRFPTRVLQETLGQSQQMIVRDVEVDTLDPEDLTPPAAIQTLLETSDTP